MACDCTFVRLVLHSEPRSWSDTKCSCSGQEHTFFRSGQSNAHHHPGVGACSRRNECGTSLVALADVRATPIVGCSATCVRGCVFGIRQS